MGQGKRRQKWPNMGANCRHGSIMLVQSVILVVSYWNNGVVRPADGIRRR